MKLSNPFARRLSLRIWLTVVVGMAVLTLVFGWLWSINADPPPRARYSCATKPAKWWGKPMHRPCASPGGALNSRCR